MALQSNYSDKFGANHASAYTRVVQVNIDVSAKSVRILARTFIDKNARDTDMEHIEQHVERIRDESDFDTYFASSVLDAVNVNAYSQAYTYLKTLPPGVVL